MDEFPQVDWLIDCEPREVQLEALRRSFYGYRAKDRADAEPQPQWLGNKPGAQRGWGHFMEMRLGKTPTFLNELALMVRDKGIKNGVMYAPASYKYDWCLEAEKFGMEIPFHPYEAARHKEALQFIRETKGHGVIVINYEAARLDKVMSMLSGWVDGDTIVGADESIKIKNPNSLVTKAVLVASKEARATRPLTGLPMTQGPQDLYSQLRFARRFSGLNFFAFRNRYCKMGGFKNKKVVGAKNEEELQGVLSDAGFVAKRLQWGKPTVPEFYQTKVPQTPQQIKYYGEMEEDFVTFLETGEEITADQVISKMLKLQQISSGFVYDESRNAVEIMPPHEVPKTVALREMVDEEIDGKVIVVFHYQKSGDNLLEAFKDLNPATIRSKGWMQKNGRDPQAEKKRFNQDPSCRMIIVNEASKYGHDLSGVPGNRCATTVFYESTYSLDDRSQLEMRNTASHQDWTNVYIDMVSSKVEADAAKAMAAKTSLVEAILGSYVLDRSRSEWAT